MESWDPTIMSYENVALDCAGDGPTPLLMYLRSPPHAEVHVAPHPIGR
jgi:hypothetical protein